MDRQTIYLLARERIVAAKRAMPSEELVPLPNSSMSSKDRFVLHRSIRAIWFRSIANELLFVEQVSLLCTLLKMRSTTPIWLDLAGTQDPINAMKVICVFLSGILAVDLNAFKRNSSAYQSHLLEIY